MFSYRNSNLEGETSLTLSDARRNYGLYFNSLNCQLAPRKGTIKTDSEILSFGRMMRHEIFLVAKL